MAINPAPEFPENMMGLDTTQSAVPTSYPRSIGNAVGSITGAPGALLGRALGVREYGGTPVGTSAPAPNTAAQDATNAATMKALDAKYGASDQDQVSRGIANGRLAATNAPAAVDPNANVSAWNAHVASVTAALQNLGIKNAGQVMQQPLPAYDKASGEAALQTTDGATKLLNYGYGSTIVGQGRSASGKLNDFRGVGSGAAPAGAAGVFGAPPAAGGTPFDQMHSHLLGLSQQAQQKFATGDNLGAKRIESHMQKLASIFQTLGTREYQQGELGEQGRRTGLAEQVANPQIANALLQSGLIQTGKLNDARRVKAAESGSALNPLSPMQMMSYGIDPNTGQSQFYGIPPEMAALMKR